MALYLGIDVGTSGVKVVAVDGEGLELCAVSRSLTTKRPSPGWSEQAPQEWWRAVTEAMAELLARLRRQAGEIRAIGVTGQMHGVVLLDRHHRVLRSAILWNDGRAAGEAAMLNRDYPGLAERLGVQAMPGLAAPKLLWLKNNDPEVLARTVALLSPKDYIVFRLTGVLCTDYSDAAGTWLLNQRERCWCREAMAAVGLTMDQMVPLRESCEIIGRLRPEVADALGVVRDLPVAAGGGDTPVGAVGLGCVRPGGAVISLGTSANIFTPTSGYVPAVAAAVHSFCHALPNLWYQMAAMLNGASAVQWACALVGEEVVVMDERVGETYKGPGDLLFLPYLTGERTPHNDADARGVFFGLTPATDKRALCQSVLEGVAYSLADGLHSLRSCGTVIDQAALAGGGARSAIWVQIIASVLDLPIIRYSGSERGPAFGAARLARLARDGGELTEVCREPEIEGIVEPDRLMTGRYRERLERFRRLYSRLRPEFAQQEKRDDG